MSTDNARTSLQLRSLIRANGELEVSLQDVPMPEPAADEVLVRIEATPINPSDLGLLFGAADMSTAKVTGTPARPVLNARVPEKLMKAMAGRVDESMPVGNEGAGVVIEAGSSAAAQALLGKTVAVIGGAMYAQHRSVKAEQCLLLPPGTTPAEGASCFVNPLTALGMVETMKREGHKALVHTAAASNLGQMLNRICLKDGIGLVNIVRKPEQAALLREQGARACLQHRLTRLHRRADRRPGRDRRDDRLRCHRRRQAGWPDPDLHGSGDQPQCQGLQPLRIGRAQAGLPLRHAGPGTDRVQPQLRHGLGHGRLAAVPVPAEDRSGRRASNCASASPPN